MLLCLSDDTIFRIEAKRRVSNIYRWLRNWLFVFALTLLTPIWGLPLLQSEGKILLFTIYFDQIIFHGICCQIRCVHCNGCGSYKWNILLKVNIFWKYVHSRIWTVFLFEFLWWLKFSLNVFIVTSSDIVYHEFHILNSGNNFCVLKYHVTYWRTNKNEPGYNHSMLPTLQYMFRQNEY